MVIVNVSPATAFTHRGLHVATTHATRLILLLLLRPLSSLFAHAGVLNSLYTKP